MRDQSHGLREQAMSGFQIGAVAICMVINMLDGYDVLAIAFAGPPIAHAWMVKPEALGLLFSASPIGMMLGSVFVSPVGDWLGRRVGSHNAQHSLRAEDIETSRLSTYE